MGDKGVQSVRQYFHECGRPDLSNGPPRSVGARGYHSRTLYRHEREYELDRERWSWVEEEGGALWT
jgi:hypothetical protein